VPFDTTEWSLIVAAGADDTVGRQALGRLCEAYWYPLYAYVRRSGLPADDAADATQAFIASLIERRDFAQLDAGRGRFRSFLIASLRHFLANQRAHARAWKRGGRHPHVAPPWEGAEYRYRREPADADDPERLYARQWARLLLDRVLDGLREEWAARGRGPQFDALKDTIAGGGTPPYRALGEALGMTEGAVKVTVHRLRRDYRDRLRAAVARTVADPAEIDDELRALAKALRE
jgi:RNA polymerase sigma-70 factor (ECF subfamily)